jgi:hypothetical protein
MRVPHEFRKGERFNLRTRGSQSLKLQCPNVAVQCYPSQIQAIKTIKDHLRHDQLLLSAHPHSPDLLAHLQKFIENNSHYLQSIEDSDQGEQYNKFIMEADKNELLRFRQVSPCRLVVFILLFYCRS